MTISFSARTDFCAGAANKARVTISPSTEIDNHESSRAVISTSNGALAGTTGRDGLLAEARGGGVRDSVDAGGVGGVAGSAAFAVDKESIDSVGLDSDEDCSAVAATLVVSPAEGVVSRVVLSASRE